MRKIIKSLGIVFGDIGTSPIYTLTVIFLFIKPTVENVTGVLSLIVWTLMTLVTVEYAWLATSLSKKGEGGTIVLREILAPYLKSGRQAAFVTLLSFIGISLLVGDGVITPAISILSAVEGSVLIPGLEDLSREKIIFISATIAIVLFVIQRRGTEKVAFAFGPIMLLWFAALAVSGVASVWQVPSVLWGLNPYYGVKFMATHGLAGFFILSEVILCATGGEALYADMGHLGRMPIVKAWYFVFVVLVLNYLGQGAFLVSHPEAHNVLFEMIFSQASYLYVPFLLLSICATIIASQAMISGMFSIVFQGINTHVMPLFKVDYTSREMRGQIYISTVNWFLLIFVIFIMYVFKESHNLAAAYGLAVTGTMSITGVMMTWIFMMRRQFFRVFLAGAITVIDIFFLFSNMFKIPHGGYWSIIIALIPFCMILIYTSGQRRLYKALKPLNLEAFLISYEQIYNSLPKIRGTALFFAKDAAEIAPYIVHTMFKNNIIYEDNVIVSIVRTDEPFGVQYYFKEPLGSGLRVFELKAGYMEVVDVEEILKDAGINEKTIFYGLEEITTSNIIWKIFSVIKKLTPTFLIFYKLPTNKLHGVITRVEM
ncbi:MAG: KUP/HAK/KT family potassium transporter [Deltaproteobacteria bacterium]|nr:KUP/HAK/KT family potassium transporter [Deltaproteobacteria bacterium]